MKEQKFEEGKNIKTEEEASIAKEWNRLNDLYIHLLKLIIFKVLFYNIKLNQFLFRPIFDIAYQKF